MAVLTADLSRLNPAARDRVMKHMAHEDAAKRALALMEQAKMAKFYREVIVPGTKCGRLGPLKSVIHVGLQQQHAAQYGHETAWRDPDFHAWLLKHEEAFRVPEVRESTGIGWTPTLNTQR